jgi:hypothetical protein
MSSISLLEDNKIVRSQRNDTDNNPISKTEIISKNIFKNAFKILTSSRILRAAVIPSIPALILLLSNPIGLITISLAVSISIATFLTYLVAQIIYDDGIEKILSEISAVRNFFKIKLEESQIEESQIEENSQVTFIFKLGENSLYFGEKNDNPGTSIDLSNKAEIDSVDLNFMSTKNQIALDVDLLNSKLSEGNVYINHQDSEIYAEALISAFLQRNMPTNPEYATELTKTALDAHKEKL